MSAPKSRNFVPSEALRCIWMNAGILSYQLCDSGFECDDCLLDAAMRKRMLRQVDPPAAEPVHRTPETLREGYLYARNHLWARQSDPKTVRVGVEPDLSAALCATKAVVFPSSGQHLHRGQTCLWIVLEGGTLPIEVPFTGTVRNNNRKLGDQPHLVNSSPFDRGWLFELNPDEDALRDAGLLDIDSITPLYGEDESRFARLLGNALQGNRPEIGVTLADGGQRLQNLADVLGSSKYFSIVRKVYGA